MGDVILFPFHARAEKPRHPFTDVRLIAIVEGEHLCSCERNGGRLHIECVAKRDCKEFK